MSIYNSRIVKETENFILFKDLNDNEEILFKRSKDQSIERNNAVILYWNIHKTHV